MKQFLAAMLLASVASAGFSANPQVTLTTNLGAIVLELDKDKAPATVDKFLEYVRTGHFDGTIFHRVIDDFMIQGGGFDTDMKQKATRAPVENEARNGLRNEVGTVAMARTNAPHSATSQFFINLVNNAPLDYPKPDGWGYTVIGKVIAGMDVVEQIAKVRTRTVGPHQNVPAQPVVIESARIVETQ